MPKVYPKEEKLGLGDLIRSTASISMTSSIKSAKKTDLDSKIINRLKILAASDYTETPDLYPLESILVSTGVNKNKVLFLKSEVWKAKDTPVDKPLNIEHDEFDIIGHIVESKPIDDQLNEIAADTSEEDLPDLFHIHTDAVIYKHWRDEERREEIAKIIEEIEDDKWCVSMECIHNEFDYALENSAGVYTLVQRTDETSYLTEHLGQFGGNGNFGGKNLAIVPRDFIFSGKGITKKPANPHSVINPKASIEIITEKIPTSNNGETEMDEVLKNQLAETKTLLESLKAENDRLKEGMSKEKVDALNTQIATLNETVKGKDTAIDTLNTTLASLRKEIETVKTERIDIDKRVLDLQAEVTALETKVLETDRLAVLVAGNLDPEVARGLVVNLSSLSDEQFKATAAVLIENAKVAPKPTEQNSTETQAMKTTVDNAVVETTPVVATNLTASESNSLLNQVASFLDSGERVSRKSVKKRRTK